MPSKTLCIDLSDGRIALLLLHHSGRQTTAGGHVVILPPPEGGPADVAAVVAAAVEREQFVFDDCLLVLDSNEALFRDYVLPFQTRHQVANALPYELEEDLPLDVAGTLFDFTRVRIKNRSSRICCAIYNREKLTALLAALKQSGLAPSRAEPEACALSAAATWGHKEFPPTSLLLNLGSSRTVLSFLQNGVVTSVRILDLGTGQLLARARSGFTEDDLHRALLFTDFSGPTDQGSAAAGIKTALEGMVDDVDRQVALYEETAEPWPGPVFFCGEMASIKGMREMLSDRLGREAISLAESKEVRNAFDGTEAMDINSLVACLGVGLPAGADNRMQLLQGELAPPRHRRPLVQALRYSAFLAALVLLCWGLLSAVHVRRDNQALAAYQTAIEQIFAQAVPGLQGSFNRAQQMSILQNRINTLRDATKGTASSKSTFLEDLLAIHSAVDTNLDVILDRLSHEARHSSLDGTAADFRAVESLRNSLAATGRFAQVDIKGASTDKKSGRVRFEIEVAR